MSGGAGFVGSALVEELLQRGYEVAVLDVNEPQVKVDWIRSDLLDGPALSPVLRNCDYVCHLAAIADVYQALEDPLRTVRVNVEGTLNLLLAAAQANVRRFLYASTWEVYGQGVHQPVDENHPCNPDHPYSITKLAGDHLCRSVGKTSGLPVVCLRLGTAYGPRMRESSVMTRFIKAGIQGEPIQIHGSGRQFRQFTHVRDIAEAFVLALKYDGPEQIFNILSDRTISIRDLADIVRAKFDVPVEFTKSRKVEPPSAVVSSHLARRELGWQPKIEFSEAFSDLIVAHLKQT